MTKNTKFNLFECLVSLTEMFGSMR